jgi:hypothetical protein
MDAPMALIYASAGLTSAAVLYLILASTVFTQR